MILILFQADSKNYYRGEMVKENVDLETWGGVVRSCTLNQFLEDDFKDGVYEVYFGNNSLYLKIANFTLINESESLLLCFNAATSNRANKTPPFFSGDGLANSLKQSLISFSDPGTHIENVSLGWYIGTHQWLTFQDNLRTIIEEIAKKLKKNIVMFGGSGGGFASLALSLKMETDATIIAMNPQTDITEYHTSQTYLHSAYPHDGKPPRRFSSEDKIKWHAFLNENNLIGKVTKEQLGPRCRYIILQNWNDVHHLSKHIPNILPSSCEYNLSNFYGTCDNIGYLFGPWGPDHSVVWREHIETVIKSAMLQNSPSDIVQTLSKNFLPNLISEYPQQTMIKFPPKVPTPNINNHQEVLVNNNFESVHISRENAEYMLKLGPIQSLIQPREASLGAFAVLSFLEGWFNFTQNDQKMSQLNWRIDLVVMRIKVLHYLVGEIEVRKAMQNHAQLIYKIIKYHLDHIDNEIYHSKFPSETSEMIVSLKNQLNKLL
jgi:hypothetical protein